MLVAFLKLRPVWLKRKLVLKKQLSDFNWMNENLSLQDVYLIVLKYVCIILLAKETFLVFPD